MFLFTRCFVRNQAEDGYFDMSYYLSGWPTFSQVFSIYLFLYADVYLSNAPDHSCTLMPYSNAKLGLGSCSSWEPASNLPCLSQVYLNKKQTNKPKKKTHWLFYTKPFTGVWKIMSGIDNVSSVQFANQGSFLGSGLKIFVSKATF